MYQSKLQILSFMGIVLLFFFSCKKEPTPLDLPPPPPEVCDFFSFKINGASCALDETTNTFYFSINEYEKEFSPLIEVADSNVQVFINGNAITNFANNDLGVVKVNEPLPVKFILCDSTEFEYELIFSRLPIIQINTGNQSINNDPKIAVSFLLNDPDYIDHGRTEQEYESIIGIELRGGAAQTFPKKAYGLELWKDSLGTDKINESLLGMREDDDWILDAMFIDKGRMRNRVSTDIWLDFQELHYKNEEPDAKSGTHGRFVEVLLNNEYWGVYAFTERMDRKLLQLTEVDSGNDFGLLYKSVNWENGTIRFENYFDFDPLSDYWEGWEQKYPDPSNDGIFWDSLAGFTQFVIESSDVEFQNQIPQQLNIDNAVDYYIFLNLIRADDNVGKNIYFSKYNQADKFFIVPWDLDGTFGRFWDGSTTTTEVILSYNLFDRLIITNAGDFKNKLKQRWSDSRNNIFTKDVLMSYFENYATVFEANGTFERERVKWSVANTLDEEMDLASNWISGRLEKLDAYFDLL